MSKKSNFHPCLLTGYIFGSVFEKNDERVLNVIENGYGTRKFLPFGKKIYLKSDLTQK